MGSLDIGLGLCPAGLTPAGYGVSYKINSTAGKLYLDRFGIQHNAAAINPVTGDLIRNTENGIHLGLDSAQQSVYLALRTIQGSSIIPKYGVMFKKDVITAATNQKIKQAVQEALSSLIQRKIIEIIDITVELVKTTAVSYTVIWKNLTNNETLTNKFQL